MKTGPKPLPCTVSRLKKRADFLACRKGSVAHMTDFVLQLAKRADSGHDDLRIGFTVTKKTGNAVERNRIKRRLREAVGAANIPLSACGHDAVVIARRSALDASFGTLAADLETALAKAGRAGQKRRGSIKGQTSGRSDPIS